jgi:hypothetical protein
MNQAKHVIWDWNGTLVNDAHLGWEVLKFLGSLRNIMLSLKIRSSIEAFLHSLIIIVLFGTNQYLSAQEKQQVKIGAILPLTGVISSVGEAMHRGLQMAAGDAKHISVKLIVEDDATANRASAVTLA